MRPCRALVDLIEAAARQQPSVLLFEDAHWADPTTLEVLDLLIDRVREFAATGCADAPAGDFSRAGPGRAMSVP